MDAHVFVDGDGNHMVSLRIAEEEIEVAGPFDDFSEALAMAQRSVFDGGEVFA